MINVDIQIENKATPFLNRLVSALSGRAQKTISRRAALPVREEVRAHIRDQAATRHKTATALGAKPSNVLVRVANGTRIVEAEGGMSAVAIPHRMFARAFRDVQIKPKDKEYLAIPVNAAAYNKAPLTFVDLFVWRSKNKNLFLARSTGTKNNRRLELLYLLFSGVITQEQDREMLPSDETLGAAAKSGVAKYIAEVIAGGRGTAA